MPIHGVHPDATPVYGPYTPLVHDGSQFWMSGQIGIDGGADLASQTRRALEKIDTLLERAGIPKANIVMAQVLMTDMNGYDEMNGIYLDWIQDAPVRPARAAYAVAALPKGALIEIVVQGKVVA